MKDVLLLIISGIAAGFVNGLLGTGGGIVLVFVLNRLLKGNSNKDIYALTLTVTLALSVVSAVVYMSKGSINFNSSIKYGIAAIPGGVLGAYLLDRLDSRLIKKIFGGLIIFAGLNMIGLF